jgi:GntR family transcriptional regulator
MGIGQGYKIRFSCLYPLLETRILYVVVKFVRRLSFPLFLSKQFMAIIERQKPISEQVRDLLRERIKRREYAVDQRLPSEEALSSELDVSRATIRTALATLAAEGLVIRRQGDGTYINKHVIEINTRFEGVWEFTQLIENSGRVPTIQVLHNSLRPADGHETDVLGLPQDGNVLALERLFLADNTPVIYSINVIPQTIIKTPYPQDALKLPILRFLDQYCGQQYAYAVADISASIADEALDRILHVGVEKPLLCFEEVFYNYEGTPVVCATNHYNDKMLRLRVLRG